MCTFGVDNIKIRDAIKWCHASELGAECNSFLEDLRSSVGDDCVERFRELLSRVTLTSIEVIVLVVYPSGEEGWTFWPFCGVNGRYFAGFDCSVKRVDYIGLLGSSE